MVEKKNLIENNVFSFFFNFFFLNLNFKFYEILVHILTIAQNFSGQKLLRSFFCA